MDGEANTRIGIAPRSWGRRAGPIAALILGLTAAGLASAQGGAAAPPVLRIGGGSGRAESRPPKADEAPAREEGYAPTLLLSLLHEEAKLLENFGPDHPQVISVRERIRLARAGGVEKPSPRPLPEVITLTGAGVREPRPLTPALAGATDDLGTRVPPAPARDSDEPAPRDRPAAETPGLIGLLLQSVGLAAVCSFVLAALSLLVYLSYRKGGASPLIQVHLVNTQAGAGDAPARGAPPPAAGRSPQGAPAEAGPVAAASEPAPAERGRDEMIAEQVLAMNLQLKAEMLQSEGAGGDQSPFGPAGVASRVDSTESPARAGK